MLVTLGRMPDLAPPPGFLQRLDERIANRRSGWQRLLDWLVLKPLPVPARASVFVLIITVGAIGLMNGGRWTRQEEKSSYMKIAKELPAPTKGLGYLGKDEKANRFGAEKVRSGNHRRS